MPFFIPFRRSINNYRLVVPITSKVFLFDVRWNARDTAWYLDLREEDETLILGSMKVVLGATIGRVSHHDFFKSNMLTVIDTTNSNLDADFDDLGGRVQMVLTNFEDVTATG